MLKIARGRNFLVALIIVAIAAVVVGFVAYQIRQAVLFARLSATEKKIVGAWSWTYVEGVGRMVFTADHKVKEGFPPDDPNRPAIRDSDFTYLSSGTWRVEGDVLVTDIDNHLLIERFPRRSSLERPEFDRKVRRERIVSIDDEKMLFENGSPLERVKR